MNIVNITMTKMHLQLNNISQISPSVNFIGNLHLSSGKIHEIYGNSQTTLALIIAKKMEGHIFWIRTDSNPNYLNAEGIIDFINPGRLTFINVKKINDILWSMEETLRAGCIPLVISDLPEIPDFTAVRRLHLALRSNANNERICLGLLLTPQNDAKLFSNKSIYLPILEIHEDEKASFKYLYSLPLRSGSANGT